MNLLVTGAWHDAQHHIAKIEAMGHKVVFMQHEQDSMPCPFGWVEGVIANGLFLTHPIEKFSNLEYVQLTSAGYDRVPMEYVKEHQITIFNAKDVYSVPMAEHVLAGVLAIYRQLPFFFNNQKAHEWVKSRKCLELAGKTVCIVGCGNVGNECAKRFKALGCCVIGINRTIFDSQDYHAIVTLKSLDKMLPQADILVLAIALTQETKHLITAQRLNMLKSSVVIANVSRGQVIDISALLTTLPRIGGVLLDVFDEEPLAADSPLWDAENVIVTPHNSFVGEGNSKRMSHLIYKNLEAWNEVPFNFTQE